MESIIVALIAATPPTLMALASWRKSKETHQEVRTNHGKRAGEYLEYLEGLTDDVLFIKAYMVTKNEFDAHTSLPASLAHPSGSQN